MDTHWKHSIDQTLQNTRATLRRLQERHAHYDVAKRRVDDAFGPLSGGGTPYAAAAGGYGGYNDSTIGRSRRSNDLGSPDHRQHVSTPFLHTSTPLGNRTGYGVADSSAVNGGGGGGGGGGGEGYSVPPPLPPGRAGAYGARRGSTLSAIYGTNSALWESHDFAPMGVKELADSLQVLRAQLKNVTVELELERTVRADAQRELAGRQAKEVGELHRVVRQLQDDNAFLRESVRALESRLAFGNTSTPLGGGAAAGSRYLYGTNLSHSLGEAKSSFLGPSSTLDAAAAAGGSPSDERVRQRVADLESKIHRQQSLLDDRRSSTDQLLKELVDAKVATEVERMRSIAREAAREATEDLVRVRMNAMQSMFHEELRRVLEKTGVTEEITTATERLFRKYERDYDSRLAAVQETLSGLQQATAGAAGVKDRLSELERKVSSGFETVEKGLSTAQREFLDGHLRLTQVTSSRLEATRVELLSEVNSLFQEYKQSQQREGNNVRESDVRRIVEGAVAPLESRVSFLAESARTAKEVHEQWQRQYTTRVTELEEKLASATQVESTLQRLTESQGSTLEKLRADQSASQSQLRTMTATLEDTEKAASDATALVARLQEQYGEALRRVEAQEKRNAVSIDTLRGSVDSLIGDKDALIERVGHVDGAVRACESGWTRAVQPLAVKVESLQSTVNQSCLPVLDTLQEANSELSAKVTQLVSSRASHDRMVAQQLSDARRDAEERVSTLEAKVQRDADEARVRHNTQTESLQRDITAVRTALTTLSSDANLGLEGLAERVERVEKDCRQMAIEKEAAQANVPAEEAKVQAVPPPPDATMLSATAVEEATAKQKEWTLQQLEAADRRQEEKLRQELAALRRTLEEADQHLSDRADQQADETAAQVRRVEKTVSTQHHAMQEAVRAAEERLDAASVSNHERVKELLAPQRLVHTLVAEPSCVQQLAGTLQSQMTSSNDTVEALAQLRSSMNALEQRQAPLAKAIAGLEVRVEEAKAAPTAVSISEEAETTATPALPVAGEQASATAANVALQQRLASVEDTLEQTMPLLKRQIKDVQNNALECQTRLEDAIPALQLRLTATEAHCRELVESFSTVGSLVQQRVNAAAEATREHHEAIIEPLSTRARQLEEQCGRLRSAQEQLVTRHDTIEGDAAEVRRLLDTLRAQQAGLSDRVGTQEEFLLGELRPLQTQISQLRHETEDVKRAAANTVTTAAAPVADPGDPTTADASAVEELHRQMDALVRRLDALEGFAEGIDGSGEAGLRVTADALAGLRDSLYQCLTKAGEYLRKDRWAMGPVPSDADTAAAEGSVMATAQPPKLEALEDLFLFLLAQLSNIHNALGTLQQNAVATLELIQQQELDVLAIPPLQQAVLQLAEGVKPIAEAAGMDPAIFSVDVGFPDEDDA